MRLSAAVRMTALKRTLVVMLTTFGASVLGTLLKIIVPAQMLTESKGTVGAMVGLVTLLLELVLSFLVFTALSVFSGEQSEAQSLGPLLIELDVSFENYGEGGESGRAGLRAALERARKLKVLAENEAARAGDIAAASSPTG
jgi:hypothetical protein